MLGHECLDDRLHGGHVIMLGPGNEEAAALSGINVRGHKIAVYAICGLLSAITSLLLYLLGQSFNIMTLGGLALAVGILVDDATVEIENINRNRHLGKGLVRAILDGAQQIAVPAFVMLGRLHKTFGVAPMGPNSHAVLREG